VDNVGKAAVAEFIGTFALIFFGAGAIIMTGGQDLVAIALAHGLAIAIMVSIMAHISGGVFNPAIQIALWVTGKMPTGRSAVYIVAELLGGLAAAFFLKYIGPTPAFDAVTGGIPAVADGFAVGKAVVLEAMMTFFLVWAVFGTADQPVAPELQRFAYDRAGSTVTEIEGASHLVMKSQPDIVAGVIREAVIATAVNRAA